MARLIGVRHLDDAQLLAEHRRTGVMTTDVTIVRRRNAVQNELKRRGYEAVGTESPRKREKRTSKATIRAKSSVYRERIKREARHNPKQNTRRIALKNIRGASTEELRSVYDRMNAPGYQAGRGDDKRYYAIKDELRARANPHVALVHQKTGRAIGGRRVTRKQVTRVSGITGKSQRKH